MTIHYSHFYSYHICLLFHGITVYLNLSVMNDSMYDESAKHRCFSLGGCGLGRDCFLLIFVQFGSGNAIISQKLANTQTDTHTINMRRNNYSNKYITPLN